MLEYSTGSRPLIASGTRIGSYVIEGLIGRGAMGNVYVAHHVELERPVAIKILQGLDRDDAAAARFRREARAIASLRHPNILAIYDQGTWRDVPYIVVEYVPGGSLADRLRERKEWEVEEAIAIIEGIGAALDHAHSVGVVHRDVKPANVLLTAAGMPVLADFGLARLTREATTTLTQPGTTAGTPAYMSPEQAAGEEAGPWADIYSLAAVAYELLTGRLPFAGRGVSEILYAHVHEDPPTPSSIRPELPAHLDAVLLKGLAKQPAERWENCAAMVAALRGLENRPIKLRVPWPHLGLSAVWLRRIAAGAAIAAAGGVLLWRFHGEPVAPVSLGQAPRSPAPVNSSPLTSPAPAPAATAVAPTPIASGQPAPGSAPSATPPPAQSAPAPAQSSAPPSSGPSPSPSPAQSPNPPASASAPGAPTGILAVTSGVGSVRVSWTPPASDGGSPITSYSVYGSSNSLKATAAGDATSVIVTGVQTGVTYTFTVQAFNAAGGGQRSQPSNPVVGL